MMQMIPNPDITTQIIHGFEAVTPSWSASTSGFANSIFWALVLIEFSVGFMYLVLERNSLQEIAVVLFRKTLVTGMYLTLLLNPIWMKWIIQSFEQIGMAGAGVPGLSPGDVFIRGLNISSALLNSSSNSPWTWNPVPGLLVTLCAA